MLSGRFDRLCIEGSGTEDSGTEGSVIVSIPYTGSQHRIINN